MFEKVFYRIYSTLFTIIKNDKNGELFFSNSLKRCFTIVLEMCVCRR